MKNSQFDKQRMAWAWPWIGGALMLLAGWLLAPYYREIENARIERAIQEQCR
jgi:hypothetical protein